MFHFIRNVPFRKMSAEIELQRIEILNEKFLQRKKVTMMKPTISDELTKAFVQCRG